MKYSNEQAQLKMLSAGYAPLEQYPGAKQPWLCTHLSCGNKLSVTLYYVMRSKSHTCRYCHRFAEISAGQAKQIMLEAGLKPLVEYPGYDKPWRSIHTACGSTVSPRLHSVKAGSRGCKQCGWKESARKRTLSDSNAKSEMIQAGLEPLEEFKGVKSPWKCRCLNCGKTVTPQLGSIRSGRGGCKYCAGNALFTEQEAVEYMLNQNLQPLEKYVNALTAWKCKCLKCGHFTSPKLGAIRGGQGPCIYCAGKKVDPREAEDIMLRANLRPLEQFNTVRTPWKSLCLSCQNIVFPRLASVIKNGKACSKCSKTGFTTSEKGYLYFLHHPDWRMFQIGITNNPDNRLARHANLGWQILELRGPMDGLLTQKLERSILKMLKNKGADLGNVKVIGKFDGYTESWTESTFDVKSIKDLIRLTENFEVG